MKLSFSAIQFSPTEVENIFNYLYSGNLGLSEMDTEYIPQKLSGISLTVQVCIAKSTYILQAQLSWQRTISLEPLGLSGGVARDVFSN